MSILAQFKQSQNTDFPNLRPSLDLRFALAKKLDPRITFTRGSTGTYFGPDGLMRTAGVNEPRFDHDPITGQSLGLLIEEQRTNLITYSDDFSQGIWSKANCSIQSNVITAPDGNTTADKLVENSASGNKEVTQGSITFTSGTSLTFSCFIKAGERNLFRFAATTGFFASAPNAYFNLTSGTVSLIQGGITSASIIPYPNGWYRCVATMLPTSSGTGNVYITLVRSGTTSNYGGDGTSGIYIWGAQLEAGTFPTSYIPTLASTVTRSKDTVTITETNFSSWYNQTEGTFFTNVKSSTSFISGNASAFGIFTAANSLVLANYHNATSVWLFRNFTTSNNAFLNVSMPGFANRKSIATYRTGLSDYYTAAFGGSNIRDSITTSGPTNPKTGTLRTDQSYLEFNPNRLGLTPLNGTISRFTYYPIQLTNQQLINLTS